MITQIVFLFFEFAEIKYGGFWNYISDGWNLFDISQFISFIIHIWMQAFKNMKDHDSVKLFDDVLQILIVI